MAACVGWFSLGLLACGSSMSGAPDAATGDAAPPSTDTATAHETSVQETSAQETSVVPPPTCVDRSALPAWRSGMAIGEWKQLGSADITVVKPDVQPGGGYYGRIDAWNGFAADTVNSIVYLAGAGGHADYAGNEVYAIDLKASAPQWVLQMQPSPSSAYLVDQPYYSDGKPSPTHTYYSSWFIEQRKKVFRFAGSSTWGTGNGNTTAIDSWDPVLKAWAAKSTNPNMGPRPTPEMPTTKDFQTGDVYQIQGDNHLYRWDQASNTVADLGEAKAGSGSFYDIDRAAMLIDSPRRRLMIFSDGANAGNTVRVYDLTTKAWSAKSLLGPGASGAAEKKISSMAYYDFCADRMIIKTRLGGVVYQVVPTTLEATSFPTTGTPPPNAINGVHTLFQSLPNLGGYVYQPSHTAKLYFLATQ